MPESLPPFPVFTKKWHSEPYDSIDPTRPELSVKGKNVIITGGGTGIGAATAIQFAKAGAAGIAILARREGPLKESKTAIEKANPATKVIAKAADMTSRESISKALNEIASVFGKFDILIANAGYLSPAAPIATADPDEWWTSFEINIKGNFNLVQAFLPLATPNATLISVSSGIGHLPANSITTYSPYSGSKIGMAKVFEILAAEQPELQVVSIQPGVVPTDMNRNSGMALGSDSPYLPASTMVWLASPEARFLNGKYIWVNWDVDEMKARADEIANSNLLTLALEGAVFK